MYSTAIAVFIFFFVFFSYIHVTNCWKTSDDLELYETDYVSSVQIQETVAVKQPVLFKLPLDDAKSRVHQFCEKFRISQMEKYDNIDVRVKTANDYFEETNITQSVGVESVHLPLRSAQTLLATDTYSKYFSENNGEFMEETNLDGFAASHLDPLLKPPLVVFSQYDVVFGSPRAVTPLRYHNHYQRYLAVASGKIRVKMCPPKYRKTLDIIEDYDHYEFWSTLRVWSPYESLSKGDKERIDRVKMLEFDVYAGHVLFVPPYWLYSIRFSGDADTTVCSITYDTAASIAANAKPLAIHLVQRTQTKTVVTHIKSNTSLMEDEPRDDPTKTTVTPGFRTGWEMESVETINATIAPPEITEKKGPTEIVTNAGVYKV